MERRRDPISERTVSISGYGQPDAKVRWLIPSIF
jgi:hypothetical protein